MKKSILIFLFLLTACLAYNQSAEKEYFANDFGINVTTLIGEVISLTKENEPNFGLTYRRKSKNLGFRLSGNFKINNDIENINSNNNFDQIEISEFLINSRAGIEKYKKLHHKFILAYGFDLLYLHASENSISFNTSIESKEKTRKMGAGPALRFEYYLTKKISIMTETTLYGFYAYENQKLLSGGSEINNTTSKEFAVKTSIPSVLYLNIHF